MTMATVTRRAKEKNDRFRLANNKAIYLLKQNIKSCNARRRRQRKQPKKISRSKGVLRETIRNDDF